MYTHTHVHTHTHIHTCTQTHSHTHTNSFTELTVSWEFPTLTVEEDEGDIEVCYSLNLESAIDVSILVGAQPKSDNPAIRKYGSTAIW